jgi:acetyl-CoA carboxylase carboxyl transferase subunit alpha
MREAAEALRLTAQNLHELAVIDRIIPEPLGGAHRDAKAAMASVATAIQDMLDELKDKDGSELIKDRRQKFLDIGSKGLAA